MKKNWLPFLLGARTLIYIGLLLIFRSPLFMQMVLYYMGSLAIAAAIAGFIYLKSKRHNSILVATYALPVYSGLTLSCPAPCTFPGS